MAAITQATARFAAGLSLLLLAGAFLVEYAPFADIQALRMLFGTNVLNFALRAAVPLLLGALGGILCERSGIVNIGIEGMMLAGAFAAFVAKTATNHWALGPSLLLGTCATLLTGAAMGLLHALFCLRFGMNQIISGTSLILLSMGISATFFDRDAVAVGTFAPWPVPLLSEWPVIGPLLFNKPPITYVALLTVAVVGFALAHTRWGLRTRAIGEHPRAADTAGVGVAHLQYLNTTLGGALAGLGGGYLVLEAVGQFQEGMTAGRGFIALAAVIFGNWHPVGALGASLLFGYAQAVQNELLLAQVTVLPRHFVSMIPYLVTVIAVSGLAGRVRAPGSLGQPYLRETKA
ncbi:MAG: ABC transporter permease [Caldilineaceae bacterium]|nr:ABC transporter permease [Caldilineaceae bacterium]